MTDTVRCSVDSSHAVTCEVDIGPDEVEAPSARPNPAPAPTPPPASAQTPAVSALVDRFPASREHEVHAAAVPLATLNGLSQCTSQLLGMGTMVIALKSSMLAALPAFKASFDVGACLAKDDAARQVKADQAAAVSECEANGGTPMGQVGNQLTCEVAPQVSR